jgi:glycosyltransferase involved in cell wall biosynthesis
MRIAYCTNVRLPSERAHGHQIAAVCDALYKLGHHVTVYAPFRKNTVGQDYWTYYGSDNNIQVQYIGSMDYIANPLLPGVLGLWVTNAMLRKFYRTLTGFDLLYTRWPALLPALLHTGIPIVLELHTLPMRGQAAFVRDAAQVQLIVCLTSLMKEELVRMGVDTSKVVVAGDAVDLRRFENLAPAPETRERYGLDPKRFTIGYAGQLQSMGLSKGVEVLMDALQALHNAGTDFQAVIAGGPTTAQAALHSRLSAEAQSKVHFLGHVPQSEVPAVLTACDALVYPAPKSDNPFYMRDTSPMKIFEYMASGRPIVSADLPPVHDVLGAETAYFTNPGDAHDLADTLRHMMQNPEEAQQKATHAREAVERHTWKERMKTILEALH